MSKKKGLNLQTSSYQSITEPLLADLLTPTTEAFEHEVTSVPTGDVAYTLSTTSSLPQSDSSDRKAFIPRSILVPPSEISLLEAEYATGALTSDTVVPVNGVTNTDQTTLYPNMSLNDRSMSDVLALAKNGGLGDHGKNNSDSQKTSLLDPYRALLKKQNKLGQYLATSIAANDCVGSILYMDGQLMAQAGVFGPICVLLVNIVLYLFRNVYGEAVTGLRLNGGAYSVLLNTTRKSTAAIAAVLTLLSYTATAVVSATEAVHYLKHVYNFNEKYMIWMILGVLLTFAILNFFGIGESAGVALTIFIIHLTTLTVLAVLSIVYVCKHGFAQFDENRHNQDFIQPNVTKAILFGFSAAMLGVTGFETSANFVEEQKPGVYVKTLRNMWWLSSIYNTLITLATIFCVDLHEVVSSGTESTIVARLAQVVGDSGHVFSKALCVNAFLVLSGGVLTAYVGVTGLIRRLALDRCMPQFLLAQNSWRQTNHYIIFGFFGLCSSMYVILDGNVTSLSQTYSVAFLTVMGLFALGVMMLKVKRSTLVAEVTGSWAAAFIGLCAVLIGLGASVARDHQIVYVFFLYFLVAWAFVQLMFFRFQLLKLLSYFAKLLPCHTCSKPNGRVYTFLQRAQANVQDTPMGFFTKNGDISVINKAVLYVRENEDCSWLRIIHCFEEESKIPPTLYRDVHMLNNMYPKLKIDLVLVKGTFSAAMVAYISVKLGISRNLLFITTPQPGFGHRIEDLGGVRLITH